MDDNLIQQISDAENAVAEAEKLYGSEHVEVASRLMKYAALLRQTGVRTLDAANIEARAKAIRAKIFAAEAESQKTSVNDGQNNPVEAKAAVNALVPAEQSLPPARAFLGLGGVLVALIGLFINSQYYNIIVVLVIALILADLVLGKGGWWRAIIAGLFLITGWCSIDSLPSHILLDASPIERLDFASNNQEFVDKVRDLDKPTQALIYSLCLPRGFVIDSDASNDWGRVITWKGPSHEQQTAAVPVFYLIAMDTPGAIRKGYKAYSILKAAREIVLPQLYGILDLTDTKESSPRFEDINGLQFVRLGFSGNSSDSNRRQGFVYLAEDHNRFVILAGCDWALYAAATLESMEATVSTLIEPNGVKQLDI